jgi:hypothetical protein
MDVCKHNSRALWLEREAERAVDQAQAANHRGETEIYETFMILAEQYLELAALHRLAHLKEPQ